MRKIFYVRGIMYEVRCAICACLLCIVSLSSSAQTVSVNTDGLMDVLMAPSLGAEVAISRRSTLGANFIYSPKLLVKFGKAFAVQPEYRFYFSGRPMYRHFIGIVGLYTDYKIKSGNKHYDGNAGGIGVSFGYVWNISSRLYIDFHSSLGAVFYKNKEYSDIDNYNFESERDYGYVPANNSGTICLPLRMGISIAYMLR